MKTVKFELWAPIACYDGRYLVSTCGRVMSTLRIVHRSGHGKMIMGGCILKSRSDACGYERVDLWKDNHGKTFSVHRLVAETFIPNPDCLPEVNHIDENKTNNNVDNLHWCIREFNNNFGTRNKRAGRGGPKVRRRRLLCIETGEVFNSIRDAENTFNVNHSNFIKCCNGKRKTCAGFHWRYYD